MSGLLFLEPKYIRLACSHLRNFKEKEPGKVWNFSCPKCGDSEKDLTKARAYIYRKEDNNFYYYCHNGGCGGSYFNNFLRNFNYPLYKEYMIEKFKEERKEENKEEAFEKYVKETTTQVCPPISLTGKYTLDTIESLDDDHPAKVYLKDRKIPEEHFDILYYTDEFKNYSNIVSPGKFKDPIYDEHPRIMIPFFTENGKVFAFQARSMRKEKGNKKYYTLNVCSNNGERIYGLERLDYDKTIYIVEGPFDSLFLPNAIAVAGSNFLTPKIKNIIKNHDYVIVPDNQPRNPDMIKGMWKIINKGYTICIYPKDSEEKGKDINEMIINGMTKDDVLKLINNNKYRDLKAKMALGEWAKTQE